MRQSEEFWDKKAKSYSEKPVRDMDAYNKTLDTTKKYLNKDDVVLECGCGTGTTALILAQHVKQITGSDLSREMTEIAKQKTKEQKIRNANFIKSTLFDNQFKDESYNAILAFNFLHLVEDTQKNLKRINSLLKPGGLFISKTTCLVEKGRFVAWFIYLLQKINLAPYVSYFKVAELEELIKKGGFEILESRVFAKGNPPNQYIVAKKL